MEIRLPRAPRPRRADLAIVERDEIAPSRRVRVEPLERRDRRVVEAGVQDLLVGVDRRARVVHRLVREARLLVEDDLPLFVVLGDIGAALEDVQQRRRVLRLLVDRLQRFERALLVAALLERLHVVVARARRVGELGAREPGDLQRHVELEIAVRDVRPPLAQERRERRVVGRRLGETVGVREPLAERRARRRVAHAARRVTPRAPRVVERSLGDLHRLREHRELRVRLVRILRFDLENAQEARVLSVFLVERAQECGRLAPHARFVEQALERGAARTVRAVDGQRTRVRLEARLEVADLCLANLAEA